MLAIKGSFALRVAALACIIALAAACAPAATPMPPTVSPPPQTATAVPEPTVVPLTGIVTRAALEAYAGWENLRAQDYAPDTATVATLRERWDDIEVLLFLGTWCSDSQREVPRFFKILDQAGISEPKITMYGLDRTKKDAEGLTVQWDVQYVPTFIFLRDGKELGRIIEKPKTTLESDIAEFLSVQ